MKHTGPKIKLSRYPAMYRWSSSITPVSIETGLSLRDQSYAIIHCRERRPLSRAALW